MTTPPDPALQQALNTAHDALDACATGTDLEIVHPVPREVAALLRRHGQLRSPRRERPRPCGPPTGQTRAGLTPGKNAGVRCGAWRDLNHPAGGHRTLSAGGLRWRETGRLWAALRRHPGLATISVSRTADRSSAPATMGLPLDTFAPLGAGADVVKAVLQHGNPDGAADGQTYRRLLTRVYEHGRSEEEITIRANAHPGQFLQAPAGGPVYIDTGMVPVIEALWAAGLQTRFSCQGEPHGGAYLRGEGRLPEALEHAILGAGFQTEISESAWTVWDSAAPWYAEAVHTAFMTLCGDIATQPNFRAVDDTGERYRVPWTPAPDVNGAAALHVRLAAAQRASVAAALARLSGPLDGWSPLD